MLNQITFLFIKTFSYMVLLGIQIFNFTSDYEINYHLKKHYEKSV